MGETSDDLVNHDCRWPGALHGYTFYNTPDWWKEVMDHISSTP